MEKEPVKELKLMGLTDYEAKVFIALHRIEEGTASQISKVSKVPRVSVYEVMRSLEVKGAIIVEQGKPLRYRLMPLDPALENLEKNRKEEIERMSVDLESAKISIIQNLKDDEVSAQIEEESYWTIRGDEKVKAKIRELISRAKTELKVGMSGDIWDFIEDLKEAEKRGVFLSVIVPPEVEGNFGLSNVYGIESDELNNFFHHGRSNNMGITSGSLVVADDRECIISVVNWDEGKEPLREKTCLWVRSEGLTSIFSIILEMMKHGIGKRR